MPKSDFAKSLDEVQTQVTAFLKPLGFKKKGRTYNRTTGGGLVQVVNLQMGQYPVGDHADIPGLRESAYGKFAVNLGVLLPCIGETERQKPEPGFVMEHYCSIRSRLGSLAYGRDRWFELASAPSALAATLVPLLGEFGLPFLDQFPDYAAVLAYYDVHGRLPFQNVNRAALEAAIISHHLSDPERAQHLFAKAHSADHPGFQGHVATLAKRLGYDVL